MFERFLSLFQVDWHIFQSFTRVWLEGGDPYGALPPEFKEPGWFAYPPTSLTWLSLFAPLGAASFYVWTALILVAWWLLIRDYCRPQLILLCWAPFFVHLLMGQVTFAFILALWAVYRMPKRGWVAGLLLAWAFTKPQTALIPALWLLWEERQSPIRGQLWGGLILGTLALALPPTLRDPHIWSDWLVAVRGFNKLIMQMWAWQGFGLPILLLAAYLWHRQHRGQSFGEAGWQWWITAALFPQTGLYPAVAIIPMLRVRQSYWTIGGLALSSLLIGPATQFFLPVILSGHMLAAWFLNGGPDYRPELAAEENDPGKVVASI
jgi:hypothetical protein